MIDKYTDAPRDPPLQARRPEPDRGGPADARRRRREPPGEALNSCTFKLTNTGAAAATTGPAPAGRAASLDNDIYRLSASASGAGWSAELRNALATAKFGESVDVPVYISHAAGAEPGNTVTLTATSVADPSKTATATCASTRPAATVGGSVPATLSLTLGARPRSAPSSPAWTRSTPRPPPPR